REPAHRAEDGGKPQEEAAKEGGADAGLRALGRKDLRATAHLATRAPRPPLPGGPRDAADALAAPLRSPGRRLRAPARNRLPRPHLRLREASGDATRRPVLSPPPRGRDR